MLNKFVKTLNLYSLNIVYCQKCFTNNFKNIIQNVEFVFAFKKKSIFEIFISFFYPFLLQDKKKGSKTC